MERPERSRPVTLNRWRARNERLQARKRLFEPGWWHHPAIGVIAAVGATVFTGMGVLASFRQIEAADLQASVALAQLRPLVLVRFTRHYGDEGLRTADGDIELINDGGAMVELSVDEQTTLSLYHPESGNAVRILVHEYFETHAPAVSTKGTMLSLKYRLDGPFVSAVDQWLQAQSAGKWCVIARTTVLEINYEDSMGVDHDERVFVTGDYSAKVPLKTLKTGLPEFAPWSAELVGDFDADDLLDDEEAQQKLLALLDGYAHRSHRSTASTRPEKWSCRAL